MKRGFKGLSVLLSIIMVFCLFAPYSVYADETPADGENTTPAGIVISGSEEGTSGTTPSAIDGDEEDGEDDTSGTTPSAIDGDGEEGSEEGTSGTTPSAIDGDGEEGDEEGTSGTTPSAIDGGNEDKLQQSMLGGQDDGVKTMSSSHVTYTLTVSTNDSNMGYVRSNKEGFTWIFEKGNQFIWGTTVELTAYGKSGFKFDHWEHSNEEYMDWFKYYPVFNPDGNKISVVLRGGTENKTVKAVFKPETYNVSVSVTPAGIGTVTGVGEYDYNSNVTLTASPEDSTAYKFKQWNGDLPSGVSATDAEITFKMPAKSISLEAEFEQLVAQYDVTVAASPADAGIVAGGGKYAAGTDVTVCATPGALKLFDGWYDGDSKVSDDLVYTFKAEKNINLIAKFSADETVPAGKAIIRDFKSNHDDFEFQNGETLAQVNGIVESSLGSDGKPTFKGASGDNIKNAASFSDWFNTKPGVNIAIYKDLPITEVDSVDYPGYFGYENLSFFPINGEGFGNYYNNKNYHFTLEYETTFRYDPAKTTIYAKADDDLWIFVNGILAVDLGGVHGPTKDRAFDIKHCVTGKNAGDTISFKIFYAERNTSEAVLSFKANFLAPYVPPVEPPTQYTLTTEVEHGTILPTSGTKYNAGEVATITIAPEEGYEFDKWVEDNGYTKPTPKTGTDAYEVTMNSDIKVKAIFKAKALPPTQYTLITEVENGTISPTSGAKYNAGTVVTITIAPEEGYEFDKWVEDNGYTKPTPKTETDAYEVTMNNDIKVKAIFKQIRGAIYVYKDVVGRELEALPQYTMRSAMTDYEDISDNTVFTLTLTGSTLEAPITRTISEDTGAEFTDLPLGTYYLVETLLPGYDRVDDPDNYTEITLTEEETGIEYGVVNRLVKYKLFADSGANGTISPKSTEGLEYTRGTVVDLTILPDQGYEFDRWENGEDYTVPTYDAASQTYKVTMNSDIHVKVLFKAISTPPVTPPTTISTPVSEDSGNYTLLIAVVGQGTVSPGVGANTYSKGIAVQLSATPAAGWKFDGWQGDAVDASNQIRMDSNKSVTAVFSQIPPVVVEDESTPQAPVSQPQNVEMDDEETPAAPADVTALPKTGGVPATVFYGLGGFLAAMGVTLRSKAKKKENEE